MNTKQLREDLIADYKDLKEGRLTNASARARVAMARGILETVKVEIETARLGRAIDPVDLGGEPTVTAPRRVA